MKKAFSFFLLILIAMGSFAVRAEGSSNYLYDSHSRMVPSPPAYVHERTYMSSDFDELPNLKGMQSACMKNGKIYVTCLTRLIIFDRDFNLLYTSTSYTGLDGRKTDFDSSVGIFVTDEGDYYICEPNRSRILHFDRGASEGGFLSAGAFAGRDDLSVSVCGTEERILVTARFDNLGKGASGAAIQNMNIVLGLPEDTGLSVG